MTPMQKTVATRLSAALPPDFSIEVPMLLHIDDSDATFTESQLSSLNTE